MKITRTTLLAVPATAVLAISLTACNGGNSTNASIVNSENTGVETTMDNNQPAPIFDHSDIRATAIEIEAIQALGENTTSFAFLPGVKDPIWSCPSSSVSLSPPMTRSRTRTRLTRTLTPGRTTPRR